MSADVERVSSQKSGGNEKTPLPVGEKSGIVTHDLDSEAGLQHGHLQELEVDLNIILKESGEEDFDGDQSPYPEGMSPPYLIISLC